MIIGIDLGTTHSLAAVWREGAPVLIPNPLGQVLTPSCVSIDDDGGILVGQAARERLQTHPERSASVFKRHMGSAKAYRLAGRDYRPEELSALVLKALKLDAEAFLGAPVTEAIVTVPAYFSEAQRHATRAAGRIAGLKVERLLNEPTAAALAYGLHQRGADTRFLVFDLGGGTFDVSILEMFEGVMEVRASAGDNFSGRGGFPGRAGRPVLRTGRGAGHAARGCAVHAAVRGSGRAREEVAQPCAAGTDASQRWPQRLHSGSARTGL